MSSLPDPRDHELKGAELDFHTVCNIFIILCRLLQLKIVLVQGFQ